MKIVDANVLLNAVNSAAPDHEAARSWLDRSLSGGSQVGLAWLPLVAFVRLSTRPGLFTRPLTPAEALDVVDLWTSAAAATLVHPGPRHARILRDLLGSTGTAGNLTNDAHLAALALEHRGTVVSFDADFDRFPGVRWHRPS